MFDLTVKKAWAEFHGYGNPDAYLAAKLRFLKNEIKILKKKSDEEAHQEISNIKSEVAKIQGCRVTTTY